MEETTEQENAEGKTRGSFQPLLGVKYRSIGYSTKTGNWISMCTVLSNAAEDSLMMRYVRDHQPIGYLNLVILTDQIDKGLEFHTYLQENSVPYDLEQVEFLWETFKQNDDSKEPNALSM